MTLPDGWKFKKLGDVCDFLNGFAFKSQDSINVSTVQLLRMGNLYKNTLDLDRKPVFYPEDFRQKYSRYCLSEGDLIMSLTGTVDKEDYGYAVEVSKTDRTLLLNQRIVKFINLDSGVDKTFLLYLLHSKSFLKSLYATSRGVRQANLSVLSMKKLKIPIPPLETQKRIVEILDEVFEGIEKAIANTKQNLINARELFDSYLNNIFTNKGTDWVEKKLGEVCILKSGTTLKKDLEKESGDIPYVKVADMTLEENHTQIVTSSRFLNKIDIKNNSIFPIGTIIFPKRGGAILTNKKRFTAVPICTDLNIMGVIPSNNIESKYVYYYFLNVDMRKLGSGSSIPQINNYDIEPLIIRFPENKKEQNIIVNKLDQLSAEVKRLEENYQRKVELLEELKQSILERAFRGELTDNK